MRKLVYVIIIHDDRDVKVAFMSGYITDLSEVFEIYQALCKPSMYGTDRYSVQLSSMYVEVSEDDV